ncbi:MAG: hypothetical protein DMD41_01520 [Gemmatimonadetes bacterium]|nr:MAG: hypothetical protein DMD41_01520 [Gemmatimonadota bacterium]
MATSSPGGLTLVASGDEYSARSLETVLEPAGYRVLRVATGAEALERAVSARPDLVLLATDLPDLNGLSVCGELRQDLPDLPVIGMTAAPVTRGQRLAWLRAGAWDCLAFPVDAEELLLKIDRYARAKRRADRAQEGVLVDSATGLYNGGGLKRRAREVVAAAVRAHAALACVVFGADRRLSKRGAGEGGGGGAAAEPAVRDRLGAALRSYARESDTIGWWSEVEFAVLAPGTDEEGAARLAERLADAIETAPPEPGVSPPALDVCAGYVALTDVHATPVDPEELFGRAGAALQLARTGVRGEAGARGARIRRFERA